MKNYRNALAALDLAFVFSTPAFAGDGLIWTDRTPPPPPPTQADGVLWTGKTSSQADGVLHTGKAAPASNDVLTEIAFSLLQTLLPLL
jgi:hypothetical protein